jgi:flagellar motor switch protein FliN/FliY
MAAKFLDDERILNFSELLDMEVTFVADLGHTESTLGQVLKLEKGSVIDLNMPAGESVEIYVNHRILGKGEVMVYEKNLAIRVNEVLDSDSVISFFARENR